MEVGRICGLCQLGVEATRIGLLERCDEFRSKVPKPVDVGACAGCSVCYRF